MYQKKKVLCLRLVWFFVFLNPSVVRAQECKPFCATEFSDPCTEGGAQCSACAQCTNTGEDGTGTTANDTICAIDDPNCGCNIEDVKWFCAAILIFSWAVQCLSCTFCRIRLLYALESDKGAIATATVTRVQFKDATPPGQGPNGGDGSPENWTIDYEFDAVRPDESHVRIEMRNCDVKDRTPTETKGWWEGDEILVKYLPETPEFSMWEHDEELDDSQKGWCVCVQIVICTTICGVFPLMAALILLLVKFGVLEPEERKAGDPTFGCLRKPGQGTGTLILVMLAGSLCVLAVNFASGMFGILRCCMPCARHVGVLGTEIEDDRGRVRGFEDLEEDEDESGESSEMSSEV